MSARFRFCALLLLTLLCASLAVGQKSATSSVKSLFTPQPKTPAAEPTPPAATPAPQPASLAIPLPDVAARSEDLTRMLRDIVNGLPTSQQLEAMRTTLDERREELQSKQQDLDALLAATPSTLEIREEQNYWQAMEEETALSRRQLLDWANAAQSAIQQLQAQLPQWKATLEANQATPELGPTLDVIQQAVHNIQQLQAQAQDQLRVIVNLQVRAASQDQLALDSIDRLTKAQGHLEGRLLERDSLPLWQLGRRRDVGESNELFTSAGARLRGIRAFSRDTRGALAGLLVLLLLSLFGAYRLHLATRGVQPATAEQDKALRITHHWFALGILPPLLVSYLLAPLAPLPLIGLGILLSFIPLLALLPPLIEPRFRTLLYWLAGVYLVDAAVSWISFSPTHKREVQFVTNLAVLVVFAILVRPSRMSIAEGASRARRLRVFGMQLAVLILGISLIANLFGYVKLSQFLGFLSLFSTFIAISVFAGLRVFTLLLLEGIDAPPAQQLAMIRLHRDAIARWVPRILQWIGIFIWLTATLDLMGLREWVIKRIDDVLDFHIAGGSSDITLKGVLGFFLILLIGYAISSTVRFLVREELLSRFHLSRGLPELLASTLHYLLLLAGVLSGDQRRRRRAQQVHRAHRSAGRRRRLRPAEYRQQLRLRPHSPVRAPDSHWRRARHRRHYRQGHAHRHPLQHGQDLPGSRGHHSQCQLHLRQGD